MKKLKNYETPKLYAVSYACDVVRTSNPQEKDCIVDPYDVIIGD